MDILRLSLIPLIFVVLALLWVHKSGQSEVPKDKQTSIAIVVKTIALTGMLTCLAYIWLDVTVMQLYGYVGIAIVFLWLAGLETPLGDSAVSAAILITLMLPFYIAKQFVLGFPDRKKIVLEPGVLDEETEESCLIEGRSGVVSSSLRPMGSVVIDDVEYPAKTEDGSFVDVERPITVVRGKPSLLIVAPSGMCD